MGANKNGQRIMCSVICTPNTGHPVLEVYPYEKPNYWGYISVTCSFFALFVAIRSE